jgi:hypothetical protein
MPLFHHSQPEGDDGPSAGETPSPDSDALLSHFSGIPLPERAAEILAGVASQIPSGGRSAMDRLFDPWLPYDHQYTAEDHPDSWYSLKYLLAETFQALELARLIVRIDESPRGDLMSYYAVSSDGTAALERGDVAEVVKRRVPD